MFESPLCVSPIKADWEFRFFFVFFFSVNYYFPSCSSCSCSSCSRSSSSRKAQIATKTNTEKWAFLRLRRFSCAVCPLVSCGGFLLEEGDNASAAFVPILMWPCDFDSRNTFNSSLVWELVEFELDLSWVLVEFLVEFCVCLFCF